MRSNSKRAIGAAFTLMLAHACGPSSRVFHEHAGAGAPSEAGAAGEGGHDAGASGEAGATSAGEAGAGGAGASGRGEAGAGDGGASGTTPAAGGVPGVVDQTGHTSGGSPAAGTAGTAGVAPSPCPGECEPDHVDVQSQPCGSCNTGTQTRTRTCSAACSYGAWSAWGACGGVTAQCTPGHWTCCAPGAWMWCVTETCKWSGNCDPVSCASSGDCNC